MSQPPLSQRIRELEAELGCSLSVRTPQGMSLAAPGEVLLVEARRLLVGVDEARERVRRAAGDVGFRVGVLGPGEAALSAGIVAGFVGRAVAFVPEQVVRHHPVEGISYLPVEDLAPARLVLAWRRTDRNPMVTDYVTAFRAAVRTYHPVL